MRDEITCKTVPLRGASPPSRVREDAEERAARVQAHADRVHPMVDAIREEESRVRRNVGSPVERANLNNARRRRQRTLARRRAAEIAGKKGLDADRKVG